MARNFLLLLLLLFLLCSISDSKEWKPCSELNHKLRIQCRCNVAGLLTPGEIEVFEIDCDGIVFYKEISQLPNNFPIISYSQRFSGPTVLNGYIKSFGTLKFPIKSLDLSSNSIRTLPGKVFNNAEKTLTKLFLQNNLLGDTLNPIFSSSEFHKLHELELLDLSNNKIKSIEEGLLRGCTNLEELYLDENYLSLIPKNSFNGPIHLKKLSLNGNLLTRIVYESFSSQSQLNIINLNNNQINIIESGSLRGLRNLSTIYLSYNRITTLNSDTFSGVSTLQELDLSNNFLNQFPTIALQYNTLLMHLNLSGNIIQKLDFENFKQLRNLKILDLSRNGLTTIPSGTFRNLKYLKYLDLSLNSLRTIEDDALEGLLNIETFIMRDNNILLVPGSALGRLPNLSTLRLDFNRIAALSSGILDSIQSSDIKILSLSRNVFREIPPNSFQKFKNLQYLDLTGNSLITINTDLFLGLETSLLQLSLKQNKINNFGLTPLNLGGLLELDVSENYLSDLSNNTFDLMENIKILNISGNNHITTLPSNLLNPLKFLEVMDLSKCGLKYIVNDFFANQHYLKTILLNNNYIVELSEGTFTNLWHIIILDLSFNKISVIKPLSFTNVMSIKILSLKGNELTTFRGEIFNTGTGLEELDISDNMLKYLYPNSFLIHPRLRYLKISNNRLETFSPDLLSPLQYLESVDLSGNHLKTIEELTFARLPYLKSLNLAENELESLSEMTFHNSTQLQYINLSFNNLERIGERTFEGIIRLASLNVKGNQLIELAELLFDRSKVQYVENINLSRNNFSYVPIKTFQKQFDFLSSVDLSFNKITEIPTEDNILLNIKNVDLSFNPLSMTAIKNIFNEPKTIRELNLAGTGIKSITSLETPFLQKLNLSYNNLENIDPAAFRRTTLLETLDLSNNLITSLENLSKSWQNLLNLQILNLSNNLFEKIAYGNLKHLQLLRSLDLSGLKKCSQFDAKIFKHVPNLLKLNLYGLPFLGYIDIKNIMELLPIITAVDVEVKDSTFGVDQIQLVNHPRLNNICLRGENLKVISSGTLAGFRNRYLTLKLINTDITMLPPGLLFPVPRSAFLNLDISESKLKSLSPQFLSALEDRRNNFNLIGLNSNPIFCNCNARAFRRWLLYSKITNISCKSPEHLKEKLLTEIGDEELICDQHNTKISTAPQISDIIYNSTTTFLTQSTTKDPLIIWSMETTSPTTTSKKKFVHIKQAAISNDDTLIIGVVGGVVAFITILIIIICIIRLKISNPHYNNGTIIPITPLSMGLNTMPIKYNKKEPTAHVYTLPPYSSTNFATFPHKNMKNVAQNLSQPKTIYSTMSRIPYYSPGPHQQQYINSNEQYVIYSDDKAY